MENTSFEFQLNQVELTNSLKNQLIIEIHDLFIYLTYLFSNKNQLNLKLFQFPLVDKNTLFNSLKDILNEEDSIELKLLYSINNTFQSELKNWININFPTIHIGQHNFSENNIQKGLKFIQNELNVELIPNDKFMLVNIGNSINYYNVSLKDNILELVFVNEISPDTILAIASLYKENLEWNSFIEGAQTGNKDNMDLMVRDIFGESSSTAKLMGHITAASFSKLKNIRKKDQIKMEDMSASLVFLQCINMTQLAVLNANIYQISDIIYSGWFISRFNHVSNVVHQSTGFWSGFSKKAKSDPITQWIQSLSLLDTK